MSEHWIRLRGGWRCLPSPDNPSAAYPITLPTRWAPGQAGRLRLVRQFGLPAIDRRRERVALRIAEVPGVVAIRLNGRPIDLPGGDGRDVLELGEDQLRPRNELVLEVDPDRAAARQPGQPEWGHVALLVRPLEDMPPAGSGHTPAP